MAAVSFSVTGFHLKNVISPIKIINQLDLMIQRSIYQGSGRLMIRGRFKFFMLGVLFLSLVVCGACSTTQPAANGNFIISTGYLTGGNVGMDYWQRLQATGNNGNVTWSLQEGSLPDGLSLNNKTGIISGKPTTEGNYQFTVRATDSKGSAVTKSCSIVIKSSTETTSQSQLAFVTTSLPDGTVGKLYEQKLAAANGTGNYTWSIFAGSMPDGLSFVAATGLITGTPKTASKYNFTIKLSDGINTAYQYLSVKINTAPLVIETDSQLPDGTVGVEYLQVLHASGGASSYTWSITGGEMPDSIGLEVLDAEISGTPTEAGTYNFSIKVTDGTNNAIKSFSLTINPAPSE